MRKFCISLISFAIIILVIVGIATPKTPVKTEYLRIHIRANSNSETDQNVKMAVKEAVVNYLLPIVSSCDTKQKAIEAVDAALNGVSETADETLKENGFLYGARAAVKNEKFPTRVYNNLTLDSGYYDALIVYLGDGAGDNWWCVVYPPLCFTGEGENYVYKSKIYEIVNDFYLKHKKEKV